MKLIFMYKMHRSMHVFLYSFSYMYKKIIVVFVFVFSVHKCIRKKERDMTEKSIMTCVDCNCKLYMVNGKWRVVCERIGTETLDSTFYIVYVERKNERKRVDKNKHYFVLLMAQVMCSVCVCVWCVGEEDEERRDKIEKKVNYAEVLSRERGFIMRPL